MYVRGIYSFFRLCSIYTFESQLFWWLLQDFPFPLTLSKGGSYGDTKARLGSLFRRVVKQKREWGVASTIGPTPCPSKFILFIHLLRLCSSKLLIYVVESTDLILTLFSLTSHLESWKCLQKKKKKKIRIISKQALSVLGMLAMFPGAGTECKAPNCNWYKSNSLLWLSLHLNALFHTNQKERWKGRKNIIFPIGTVS